jgi:phosphomannomutase
MAIHFGTSGWRAVVAERLGAVDSNDRFITPKQLIVILFDYLVESGDWFGGVARSAATSNLVDRVAQKFGRQVYKTPVGFKFIGELINENKIVLGGEESAGLSIKGHYPEKDGILTCLLAAQAVAARSASLTGQLEALFADIGRLESGRIGIRLIPDLMPKLKDQLTQAKCYWRTAGQTNHQARWPENHFRRRFMAVSASVGNRTPGTHLCGIRIGEGLGGVA